MKYLVLTLLLFVGCAANPAANVKASIGPICPNYVESHEIPYFDSTEELGKHFPYIIINGERLEYDPIKKWFYYSGSDIRALWFEAQDEKGDPIRILMTPFRRNPETNKPELYQNGKWVDAPADLMPPEPPQNKEQIKI